MKVYRSQSLFLLNPLPVRRVICSNIVDGWHVNVRVWCTPKLYFKTSKIDHLLSLLLFYINSDSTRLPDDLNKNKHISEIKYVLCSSTVSEELTRAVLAFREYVLTETWSFDHTITYMSNYLLFIYGSFLPHMVWSCDQHSVIWLAVPNDTYTI